MMTTSHLEMKVEGDVTTQLESKLDLDKMAPQVLSLLKFINF